MPRSSDMQKFMQLSWGHRPNETQERKRCWGRGTVLMLALPRVGSVLCSSRNPGIAPSERSLSCEKKSYSGAYNRATSGLPRVLGLFGHLLEFHRARSKMSQTASQDRAKRAGWADNLSSAGTYSKRRGSPYAEENAHLRVLSTRGKQHTLLEKPSFQHEQQTYCPRRTVVDGLMSSRSFLKPRLPSKSIEKVAGYAKRKQVHTVGTLWAAPVL